MPSTWVGPAGSRVAVAVASAIVTAVVIAGGVAVASVGNNSVTSAKIRNGAVRSVDIKNGAVQGVDLKDGTVGVADVGTPLKPMWAKVDAQAQGALVLSGRSVTGAGRDLPGVYLVDFNRSVVGCGWTVALNDVDAGAAPPGEIAVERTSANDVDTLTVRTFNSAGAPVDLGDSDAFTVQVLC